MVRTKLILIAACLSVHLSACGVYRFNPSGKSDFEALSVERFENNTIEYELTDRMTDLVIDAIRSNATFKLVSRESAEAVLSGTLTRYAREPYEYDASDNVLAYGVTMDFEIVLKNPSDDSEIWTERFSQQGVYQVDNQTEEDAQEEAIERLIDQIINRTSRSW